MVFKFYDALTTCITISNQVLQVLSFKKSSFPSNKNYD